MIYPTLGLLSLALCQLHLHLPLGHQPARVIRFIISFHSHLDNLPPPSLSPRMHVNNLALSSTPSPPPLLHNKHNIHTYIPQSFISTSHSFSPPPHLVSSRRCRTMSFRHYHIIAYGYFFYHPSPSLNSLPSLRTSVVFSERAYVRFFFQQLTTDDGLRMGST